MYKIGDVVDVECIIDSIMRKRECPIKYGLYCKATNKYVGAFLYEDLITLAHGPDDLLLGDTVKIKTSIIEIFRATDSVRYALQFKNGIDMYVNASDLPKRFKIGDRVDIDCQLKAYNYYEDKECPDQYKSKLYIRIPGNSGVYTIDTDYRPTVLSEINTVSIPGKVMYADNSGIDISAALNGINVIFTITDKHLDKVEVVE